MRRFITFLGFLFFLSAKSYAADFSTSYDVAYEVLPTSETQVTQKMTIKNLSNQLYAASYELTISHVKIYDVTASSKNSTLKTNVKTADEKTVVTVYFNDQVIGENNELIFTLKYKSKDISFKNGQVLDIGIPKLPNQSNVENYEVTLVIPESFGPIMSISPVVTSLKSEKGKNYYTFDTNAVKNNAISASFGKNQIFNFRVQYHLQNPEKMPVKIEVALIPDIRGRQKVYLKSLSKQPESIVLDKDGNYIATYSLAPNANITVEEVGTVAVQSISINVSKGGAFSDIPQTLKEYIIKQKYWEVESPSIKSIASKLKDPSLNVSQNAKNIYDYVTTGLKYSEKKGESQTVERLGAVGALSNPDQVICMEFVDLFIAIARSEGIPAREINGYAYDRNSPLLPLPINIKGGDVLHAWVEFFDPAFGWVWVDPTWGSTSGLDYFSKMDTNHVAFAVKGMSSEYPLPAGSYKTGVEDKPQVDISFASQENVLDQYKTDFKAYEVSRGDILNRLMGKKIIVRNTGNVTLYKVGGKDITIPPLSETYINVVVMGNKASVSFEEFELQNIKKYR